jgi:hypothetical protein
MKTYAIKANRTDDDVVKNNDETLETGYSSEEAQIASIQYQKTGEFSAVRIEEEETKPAPRVIRSVESDRAGVKFTVVRCDGRAKGAPPSP